MTAFLNTINPRRHYKERLPRCTTRTCPRTTSGLEFVGRLPTPAALEAKCARLQDWAKGPAVAASEIDFQPRSHGYSSSKRKTLPQATSTWWSTATKRQQSRLLIHRGASTKPSGAASLAPLGESDRRADRLRLGGGVGTAFDTTAWSAS